MTEISKLTNTNLINYGYGYNSTNSIAIIWSIDDVRHATENYETVDVDLTDEECMEVLDYCLDNHDAEYGMSWDSILWAIEHLFIDKPYEPKFPVPNGSFSPPGHSEDEEESQIRREGIVE